MHLRANIWARCAPAKAPCLTCRRCVVMSFAFYWKLFVICKFSHTRNFVLFLAQLLYKQSFLLCWLRFIFGFDARENNDFMFSWYCFEALTERSCNKCWMKRLRLVRCNKVNLSIVTIAPLQAFCAPNPDEFFFVQFFCLIVLHHLLALPRHPHLSCGHERRATQPSLVLLSLCHVTRSAFADVLLQLVQSALKSGEFAALIRLKVACASHAL